jgi:nitrogenase molybdenum-iron protein alpha/beta subunit/molybdenum cofactor biosynthesis enzyme MoaA
MSNRNFTNLNMNPCKMCMPMGAVTAFKGIENSMVILHGSQGCSTYIRRHMAEHYNEPIDVASSSLNEEGTVYGGEKNLKTGIRNIIALYTPSVIGVCTTCLAETIGEDIERIVEEFIIENGESDTVIIPVHTAGYAGSQVEGYYAALRSILEATRFKRWINSRINIIPGLMSPGDIRNIKRILEMFHVEYVIYPDISETLDAPYSKEYKNIPAGGTSLDSISGMAGAAATIEMGLSVPDALSPGKFLEQLYGVPLYRCSLPIGLKNTDIFVELISEITDKSVPAELQKERGRLLDGMIDSHKYNGEGKAAIFGDPEQVYAITGLCAENGIETLLACTGSKSKNLKTLIEGLALPKQPMVLDDTDFETIQAKSAQLKPNILIGNSDGRVLTEKLGIPLVRAGYPIHDRVGGQRLVHTGYNGSLMLLDKITNTLLEGKNENYRRNSYDKYFTGSGNKQEESLHDAGHFIAGIKQEHTAAPAAAVSAIIAKTAEHPCFSSGACHNARLHIPVAPACNISCNYCNRKFDCVNESRPGVTSRVLNPLEAAERFIEARSRLKNLKVVGIAGPGDALANFENTRQSLQLIRQLDPDITFCLSTNGLMLPEYASQLVELGVTHVTVTVNAIDPVIASKIYREVNYKGRKITGVEAAGILLKNQLEGLSLLTSKGVVCKVNTVMIEGVNDKHIPEVIKKVQEYGVQLSNIMPLIPAAGSMFENIPATDTNELNEMRKSCGSILKQMYHCRQCRADAAGTIADDRSAELFGKNDGSGKGCGTGKSDGSGKGCGTGKSDGSGKGCGTGKSEGSGKGCGTGKGDGSGKGCGTGKGDGSGKGCDTECSCKGNTNLDFQYKPEEKLILEEVS